MWEQEFIMSAYFQCPLSRLKQENKQLLACIHSHLHPWMYIMTLSYTMYTPSSSSEQAQSAEAMRRARLLDTLSAWSPSRFIQRNGIRSSVTPAHMLTEAAVLQSAIQVDRKASWLPCHYTSSTECRTTRRLLKEDGAK